MVLALAAGTALVLAPLALLGTAEAAPAAPAGSSATTKGTHAKALRHLSQIALANEKVTTTTAAPAPVTTPPTTAPKVVFVAPAPAPTYSGRVASGQATYYGAAAGSCASKVAPRGTTVKVTNQATGASITCVVNDYEEATWPRVIDLSSSDFGRLASLSSGVISVTLEW